MPRRLRIAFRRTYELACAAGSYLLSGKDITTTYGGTTTFGFKIERTGVSYTTLQAAITAANSGDTILGTPGTYSQYGIVISKSLTIKSSISPQKVVLQGVVNGASILQINAGVSSVTLEDLELRGNKSSGGFAAGVTTLGSTGSVTLRRCKVEECTNGFISSNSDFTCALTLESCEFVNNGNDSTATHNLYIGAIESLTIRGCWIHNTKNRAQYIAEYGASDLWRESQGHLVKCRARTTLVEASRVTMEVQSPTNGANRCFDICNGGDLTIRGCLIEYRTGQNGGQGQAIAWAPEGSFNLSGQAFEAARTFNVRIYQNTIVARSEYQTAVTNEIPIWIAQGNYGYDQSGILTAAHFGSQPTPAPSTYAVQDNIFAGWVNTPPRVIQGGYLTFLSETTTITTSTTYAISTTTNTCGALALLTSASTYDYTPVSAVDGSQNWAAYSYVHPASYATRTDLTRGGVAVANWMPAAGYFKDVSLATIAADADPDPTMQAVYRGGNGYEASWTAFNGGCYAPTLGTYGSLLFFGGGNRSYDGNAVTRYDVATRRSWRLSEPALYGTYAPAGAGGNPPAVNNEDGSGIATNVDIYGGFPNNTPFPCHTYMTPLFLPSDAGGGSSGSWLYLSHAQNHTAITTPTFWMLDVAAGTWSKWTPGPTFGLYNNNALCYDSGRKGIWMVGPSANYGAPKLWFFDIARRVYTQVTLTGAGASGNQYTSAVTPYQPGPTYHPTKDCIVFASCLTTYGGHGPLMVVTDVSGVTVSAGVPSGSARVEVMVDSGIRMPSLFTSNGGLDIGRLEYCSYDGNLWGLDQHDISGNKARLYRLEPPAGAVTGTWTWTRFDLSSADGSSVRLKSSAPPNFYSVGETPFMGRFAFVPGLKSFVWSDHPNLPVQMGRPASFV